MRLHPFFTVNSPIIFLKYTFELRISCLIRLDQFYTAFAGERTMKKAWNYRRPRLCGSSLDFEFVTECMK